MSDLFRHTSRDGKVYSSSVLHIFCTYLQNISVLQIFFWFPEDVPMTIDYSIIIIIMYHHLYDAVAFRHFHQAQMY